MARFPGFFNATQYFGSTNSAKDQQDSFWDQQSVSANHSSGVFNGNAAQPNHFMNNTQECFVDGWEDWPDDFDDSEIQENELNSFNPGSEKLVVPDREDSQTSSSEEDSPSPGMDPELNSWVEEETPDYGYTSYNNSAASFFDGHFNTQQPGIMTQHDGRSYASVCQSGTTAPPDNSPSNTNYQQDYWSTPTFQDPYAVQEVNPEVADTHENAPTFESWSREPELGSWSPVFNHDDESFANSTQEVPSTLPQPLQVADSTQEPLVNSLRPSEELDAHVPQQQATSSTADFFGHDEEQQDSAWSALTESDPQKAALWGNLPDIHPPSGHVPVENSPFHQDAAVVSQQNSCGLFQETMASEPDRQSSVQQYPGMESPSGVFQTNMPSEQDPQFSLQQYPVMESPSGFFQINSGSEPVINEDSTMGQSMSHLKSIADSMQNDPEDLSVAEESPSMQPLHQDGDSVIKQSFSAEQMQPPKQMSSTVANEAFYPSQELGQQMYNPNLFYDQQMKADPTQEERVASEETHQTKEPHFDELQPWQQPIADPAREVESLVEEPSNLHPSHDSSAFESSPMPQVNELPQEQVFLSTGAISEQEKSDMAQNNFLPGYNKANSEATQLQEFEITPTKTSEQSAIADDFQNSFDKNNSTTDSTQLVPASVSSRGFSGQSVTPDISCPSDSVQGFFRNENITSESSHPCETPQQFIKPEIPGAPDILQDSFHHDNSSANSSNPLELKMPSRESFKQSQTPDIPIEPDSPGDALQAAFLQKQLAGKAPAASPRTSLWMNGTALPTPCVLAPAAIVTPVETPQLRENDQAPTYNKQEPPSSVTPTLMQPDSVDKNIPAVVRQQSPAVHSQGTSLPVVIHQQVPSRELPVSANPYNQGSELPSVLNQQIPPAPFAPGPTPPLVHPDSQGVEHPVAVSQQMPPASYFGGVTSVSTVYNGRVTELPSALNPQMSSASSAFVTTPVPTHSDSQGTALPPVTNQLMAPHGQSVSGASTMSIHPGNKVTEFPPEVNQQIPPAPFAPGPTPPLVNPDSQGVGHPVAVSQQMPPASYSGRVTSVSRVYDGQVTELPSALNSQMSSASSAFVTTPVPTHSDSQGTALPPVTNQLMAPHGQSLSGVSTMSIHPGNKVTEFPPVVNQQIQPVPSPLGPTHAFMHSSNESTAVPAVTSQQIQSYNPVPAGVTPIPTGSVNESTVPFTANNQEISSVPPTINDSLQERHPSRVVPAIESSPVAAKQQQKAESANPMSLASLLQGGQPRPKKKTSQPSALPAPDAGPSFAAVDSVNSFSDNPPSESINSCCAPSAQQLNSGLEPKPLQNSSQQIGHQSFDSPRRQDESQNSYERDYNNPYSQEKQRVPDELPYYGTADPHDRRDNYYQHDQRDSYKSHNRRDPYQHEHDSRDLDRPYYDRREPERRNFDRRGEYDRRDSDYGRRSYDNSREYDRWSYDGRDYGRRDSYNNRDSYYDYGYSPRMGRRGYNDGRGSREDVYRGSNQYSGRSTPSSQDRNSPGPYDYSASPYASHQYGYPSYTDSHSMDLYQYQYMMYLYQFHPQHYEQYCQQLGYYSSGYTPEQLAQYYAGYGYESSQPTEQAPEQEVPQPEPERFTPLLYRVQHPLVRFSGGKLVSLIGSEDSETPKCTLASVQMVFSIEETEVIKLFPGPLSSQYSSRTEVMAFCEKRSCGAILTTDGVVKSLVWKVLGSLVKHNGAFVACDLAEVIMANWRSSNDSGENDFLAPESLPPTEIDTNQHVMVFREMLLAGATKDALEYCMRYRLWGHAMMLSLKLDKKIQVEVSNRFLKTMTDFDPIRTVYDHLSGRQPVALMTPDDWQRSLAAMVANPPRQHPQCIKKNITCLGDTLMSNEQVWAAHLCYLLAGEKFGFPTEDKTKMAIMGIDHRTNKIAEQHLPLENLQMMEVLEYAISLSDEEFFIPVLQSFKFVHANKLAEAGFTEEALHYLELIGEVIIKHPTHCNVTLVKNVRELTDRLTSDNQEAADLLEMLDKVLQTKETTSQISSSVTESESEVEEPLAESSASFFSGYDPSTNTPKHQPEQMDEAQRQLSYTETSMSAPSVAQEPVAQEVEYKQDYWAHGMPTGDNQEAFTGGLNAQATQPELIPAFIPKAPEPAAQVPFFVPGPPVAQPLPVQNEQTETVEEQPVVNGRQWSEESKNVEPLPPKEPDVPKKPESAPKPDEKKKKKEPAARNSPMGGWFSGLLSKVIPRGPNQMILPDDSKKSIYWDEDLKRWVNTDEDEQNNAPPPPPPSDMQLGFGRNSMMPLGNATPVTSGTTTHSVGTPSFPGPAAPQQAPGATPGGMATATPPAVSKFSRKAYGGGRLAKKYVDVLNPTGQTSSNGPVMLPNSLLPSFPGPSAAINLATLFVPTPVTDPSYEEQAATEPVVANPGSRPSSRNGEDDDADQQSQHSRSSSVSLTSAEVRSYMMPQIPDPPPQSAAAPMFFDPSAFSQPKAQASPRKSRYPGQIRK